MDPLIKILIMVVIVGAIPAFFGFVFMSSRRGRVVDLRRAIAAVRLDLALKKRQTAVMGVVKAAANSDGLGEACERAGVICEGLGRDPVMAVTVRECREAEEALSLELGKVMTGTASGLVLADGVREALEEAEAGVVQAIGRFDTAVLEYNRARNGFPGWLMRLEAGELFGVPLGQENFE